MIPKEWLTRKVTRQTVENIRRIDLLKENLPPGATEADIVDKGDWWKEKRFANDPQWLALVEQLQPTDELWEYKHAPMIRGSMWTSGTGVGGYAIVRNGEVIATMITNV